MRRDWRSWVADAWPLGLATALVWPLLRNPGHPLARDLVFVPHQAWSDAWLGLGQDAARAVPLDAVVAAATWGLDGGLVARVVLPVVLAAAGWGAQRAVARHGWPARFLAGGLAVWNPFVVERLALGQWALLLAYAALPWIAMAAWRWARHGELRDLGVLLLGVALASLTATGGLLAVLVALSFSATGGSRSRLHRPWGLLALAVLQLPWVLPAVTATQLLPPDPAGVGAFAARGDLLPAVAAVLSMGGIWDAASVPATRDSVWSVMALVATLLAWVVGWSRLGPARRPLAVVAGVGLALAVWPTVAPEAAVWLAERVPAAGLLRDAQKWAAPYVLASVVAAGAAVRALLERWQQQESRLSAVLVLCGLPLVLLPDATTVTWPTVRPVDYPADVRAVYDRLRDEGGGDAVATLPWRSYRVFAWGNGEVSSDPLSRWTGLPVVADDSLVVGETVVTGENPVAHEVDAAMASGVRPADALGQVGVRWVVVYRDDPGAAELDLDGLALVTAGEHVALYELAAASSSRVSVPGWRRGLVLGGDLVAMGAVALALGLATRRRVTRSSDSSIRGAGC